MSLLRYIPLLALLVVLLLRWWLYGAPSFLQ